MSGGGVALGPKPRSYAQHTPKKMVRLALLSALSDRAETGRIAVVDDWKITAPKTKDAATILRKLKLTGSVLIVLAQDELDVERSFANLPEAQTTTFGELSAHDVLRADWLLFSDRTLPADPSEFSGTHVVEDGEATETPAPAKAEKAAKAGTTEQAEAPEKAEASEKAEAPEKAIEVEVGEAAEAAAPAKPRARATKRAKAVAEPEAKPEGETETDGASEEGDADA
jgi:large subunit ribosomal protein L4